MDTPSGPRRLPLAIEPMRATNGDLSDLDDGTWSFEVKWDGVRAIGFIEDGRLRLQSSNGLDITKRYPELQALAADLEGHDVILDGEIVAFNAEGRPDFGLLQQRMHVNDPKLIANWVNAQPIAWSLFDLLHLDGHDLYADPKRRPKDTSACLPYEDRRRLLEQLIEPGPAWPVPKATVGRAADGKVLLEAIEARGMEGLIAKRAGSPYEAGTRSKSWRKLKVRRRQELVVGGWTYGRNSRSGTIGALLIGYYRPDGGLAYAGRVGSGLREHDIKRLTERFARDARATSPFDPPPPREDAKDAHWVEPTTVVEVAFGEWSADGRLRHPSYLGERSDKDPRHVIREPG